MSPDTPYWIACSLLPGVGSQRLRRLSEYFPRMKEAWEASASELIESGLEPRVVHTALEARPRINLDTALEKVRRAGAQVYTLADPSYPARLREIYDAPPVLYMCGEYSDLDDWSVAIVGTRNLTMYGREVTQRLVSDLVRQGVTIVSGLARGIDAVAHRAALEAGGRTCAVFACGVDVIYPSEHRRLAADITEAGALISEYPVGSKPESGNFPQRNRIISGLTMGTIVVEAGERSGALITATRALEQNREVFAVPGPIYAPQSLGTNRLIQESGAKLILSADDVLKELNLQRLPQQLEMRHLLPENETESLLIDLLSSEPQHIDALTRQSGLTASTVSSTLVLMEFKGLVRQVGVMNYVRG